MTPPTWRPDLTDPYDLVEEVARLHGYDAIPSVLPGGPGRARAHPGPAAAPGRRARRGRRRLRRGAVLSRSSATRPGRRSGSTADDPWRRTLTLANPLSEQEPGLRTTLLPGLLRALARNVGRGQVDVALFEIGLVFHPRPDALGAGASAAASTGDPTRPRSPRWRQALPDQPRHLGVVLAGWREPKGWWGEGHPAGWADAVEAARTAARAVGAELERARGRPGRPGTPAGARNWCWDSPVVGWAGELHPGVVAALGLPARTCAAEIDLDALIDAAGRPGAGAEGVDLPGGDPGRRARSG